MNVDSGVTSAKNCSRNDVHEMFIIDQNVCIAKFNANFDK